jgi:magnesium-transporting ATPase (P-type)
MISFIITALVLWTGWRAYVTARHEGTWSNKVFFMALLGIAALCALISLPIILISPGTLQAHEVLAIVCLLVVIAVGDTSLAVYLKQWRKRDDLKRAGQNRAT